MTEQQHREVANLPPEIWQQILEMLPGNPYRSRAEHEHLTQYSILRNVSLTSKYMRSIAEPFLYRHFSTQTGIPICDFVRAVLSTPRVAKHVREVEIDTQLFEDHYINDEPDEEYWSPREGVLEFFRDKAKEYCLSDGQSGTDLAMLNELSIKLLCIALPNFDKLTIRTEGRIAVESIFNEKLRLSTDPSLLGPKELHLEDEADANGHPIGPDLCLFAGLYSLPRLNKLRLVGFHYIVNPTFSRRSVATLTRMSSDVKSLIMYDACLTRQELSKLVHMFPVLEDFSYRTGPAELEGNFSGKDAIIGLAPLSTTLKRLFLDLVVYSDPESGDRTRDFVESFMSLNHLEILQVESLVVTSRRGKRVSGDGASADTRYDCPLEPDNLWMDYFPSSLQVLQIDRAYRNIEKPLRELAKNVRKWTPALQILRLSLGRHEGAQGYTDNEVPKKAYYRDTLEPVLTDEEIERLLDKENKAKKKIELTCQHKFREPEQIGALATFVHGDDLLHTTTEHLRSGAGLRHLPDLWQEAIRKFNDASVRVLITNGFMGSTFDFDDEQQMVKFMWFPSRRRAR